jgi:hypothetical protein
MKPRSIGSRISRREFVKNNAALAAFAAARLASLRGAEKAETRKMVGVQVGSVSFVDEGVGKVLDILQERAAADTIFLSSFTHGRGLAGHQSPGYPFPGHGVQLPFRSGFGQRHACMPKVAHARAAYFHLGGLGGRVSRELKGDCPVLSIETICTRGQQTDPAPRTQADCQASVVDFEASDDAKFFAPVIATVSREPGGRGFRHGQLWGVDAAIQQVGNRR